MKISFPVAVLAVLLSSGAIGWALSRTETPPNPGGSTTTTITPVRHHRRVYHLPKGWSFIAIAHGPKLRVYRQPHRGPSITLTNQLAAGARLSLLVRKRRGRWLNVYLPIRPDGSTGWVPRTAIHLATTAYALTVRVRSHRLVLSISNRKLRTFKIGVGRSVTPTPTGTYFITELLKQPNPNGLYGPFAFGLSAYSGVLTHFGRGGNGQIGIHGTDQPWLVGTDVSHGCIRLRNPDIVWLTRRLPLGTPVLIKRD